MMILTRIQAYQSPRCLIVNHHLLALLEGALATRGREKVMGLATSGTLGGGLSKQERCRTFLTERLHAAHLVRIWVTMHLIVLVHIPERRIGTVVLCGGSLYLCGGSLYLCGGSLYNFILCGGSLNNFHFISGVV
jgi:hypothetical protein